MMQDTMVRPQPDVRLEQDLKSSLFYQSYPEYDLNEFRSESDFTDLFKLNKMLRPKARYVYEPNHCVYCGTPLQGLDQDYFERKVGHMMNFHPVVGWNLIWRTLIVLSVLGALAAAFLALSWWIVGGCVAFAVLVHRLDLMYPQFAGIEALGGVCPGHAELEALREKKKELVKSQSLIRIQKKEERKGRITGWDEKLVVEKEIPIWTKYNRAEMRNDGIEMVDLIGPEHTCPSCGFQWQNPYPEMTIMAVFNEEQIVHRKVIADGKELKKTDIGESGS